MISPVSSMVDSRSRGGTDSPRPIQHGLGFMYLQGECTKTDAVEAAKWFRLAAAQGLPGSQAVLATMYENGTGVERDLHEAKKWHTLAEKNY